MKSSLDAVGLPFESPVGKASTGNGYWDGRRARPLPSFGLCQGCGELRWREFVDWKPLCERCRNKEAGR